MGDVNSIKIEIQTHIDSFVEVEAAPIARITDSNKPAGSAETQVVRDVHKIISTYSTTPADKRARISVPLAADRSLSCVVNRAELSDPWDRRNHYDQRITCEEYQITESGRQTHTAYAATRVYFISGNVYNSDGVVDFIPVNDLPNTLTSVGAEISAYEYRAPTVRRPVVPAVEQPYIERP